MRNLVLLLFACMMSLGCMAQVLCIEKDVEVMPKNIYAARNQRKDAKGVPCGVVMFHSTIEGLKFKGQTVGEVAYDAGVYYVYLPGKCKKLEVVAPSGSVLKIGLPGIVSKTTYEATLYYVYPKGTLTCASDPSGAKVTLVSGSERVKLGKTPLKGNVEVVTGVYTVEVSKPGFQTVVKNNVKISEGKTTKLGTVKLTKSGNVSVLPTPPADEKHTFAHQNAQRTQNTSAESGFQRGKTRTGLLDDEIFNDVDYKAEFPGGMPGLMKWIGNNMIYPSAAKANNIQGRVVVKFVIDKFGKVLSAQIVKGVHPELDREVIRLVYSMPNWQPAKHEGRIVNSYYTLPVSFRL